MSSSQLITQMLISLRQKFKETKSAVGLYPEEESDVISLLEEAFNSWEDFYDYVKWSALGKELKMMLVNLLTAYYLTWVSGGESFFHAGMGLGYLLLSCFFPKYIENMQNEFKQMLQSMVGFVYFYLLTLYQTIVRSLFLAVRIILTLGFGMYSLGYALSTLGGCMTEAPESKINEDMAPLKDGSEEASGLSFDYCGLT